MPIYTLNLDHAFNDKLCQQGYAESLSRAVQAAERIRLAYHNNALPLLHLPQKIDDLPIIDEIGSHLKRRFAHLVVLGTGGSSLGGKTLQALYHNPFAAGRPALHFVDNVDPTTIDLLLESLPLSQTGFIVISKSGGTAETLCQFLTILQRYQLLYPDMVGLSDHFTIICEPGDTALRNLAEKFHLRTLDHDPQIGGRFSVLSLVGLLPAFLANIDIKAVRRGALQVLNPILREHPAQSDVVKATAWSLTALHHGYTQSVLMPYVDNLWCMARWYQQLWAESLGKGGNGSTPVAALGTVDQHSQLQLYLDGPKDKVFTIITKAASGTGALMKPEWAAAIPSLNYLAGKRMGDLLAAEQQATIETLAKNHCPTRVLHIQKVDEESLGALLMHFMLETIMTADVLGIDAFNQPSVEDGKILTRQYLQNAI